LGTGLIGRMIRRELAQSQVFSEVLAVDASAERAQDAVAAATASAPSRHGLPAVRSVTADLGSYEALVDLLKGVDIAVAALPDSLSFAANKAAVEAGCHLVDLWPMQSLRDPRAWSEDRLHLNAEGHRLVAAKVLDVLGVPSKDDWRKKWPPLEAVDPWTKRREDTLWLKNHVVPWIGRRIRGVSSGDGVPPKRPELAPLG
ncbi:MAG: saccharopine dehydrogenase NADP-binding domain-containing protein, partial [Symbiobacteriaceae bacterium]